MSDSLNANREHFNKIAAEYDKRYEKGVGQLEDEIKASADEFIGLKQGGRVLDYACGTGLLSRAFASRASQCIGIDLAESMVEAYNAKAKSEGTFPDKKEAYLGNITLPDDPSPEAFSDPKFYNFDLAGVGAGFHHFDDTTLSAKRLSERLKTGGVLFILDFLPHAPEATRSYGVTHNGFTEDNVRKMFEDAGCGGDFAFKKLKEPIVFWAGENAERKMERGVFLARGAKL